MRLSEMQQRNAARANRWHGDMDSWSGLEWAGAMCGEAGEAANIAKKLRRDEQQLAGNDETREELLSKLGEECADVFLYLCLLASRYHIDLETQIISKFNRTSDKQGFPERLTIW